MRTLFIINNITIDPYFFMHICFIIDNSPLSSQCYNLSTPNNGIHTNMSILDTIKISIETTLSELSKNGVPIWDYQKFHLFATSQPYIPLSTYQHDQLHFTYQLKQLKASQALTYPIQTIEFAIKHLSKFRILFDVQTITGFRTNSIYEPALILFFSFGLTSRKIAKLESSNIHKLMRSQYKFTHFRVCYPSQSEKDRNFQKYKSQLESSPQNKKLISIIQRFNRGQNKNIIKYVGKESLSDSLIKTISMYKPSLCCELFFQSEGKNLFPQYFGNSQINIQNFTEQKTPCKIELARYDQTDKTYIPLPQEVAFTDNFTNHVPGDMYLEEISSLHFYVDTTKKLAGNISNAVPFVQFNLINLPNRLVKLQKELQRLGANKIYFPAYASYHTNQIKKERDLYLIGLLSFRIEPKGGNFFELMISLPNFPYIEIILNLILNQKSYSDNRKIEKLLVQYHNSVPQFYHKFIGQYFKISSVQHPSLSIYQTIGATNWNNFSYHSNSLFKINTQKEDHIKQMVLSNYMRTMQLREQNAVKHSENRAQCCMIYNGPEVYKSSSKNQSKIQKNQSIIGFKLNELLDKISQFNRETNFQSYFSTKQQVKEGPMSKQLERYSQKIVNNEYFRSSGSPEYSDANQSITNIPIGLIPSKKLKGSSVKQSQSTPKRSFRKLKNIQDDDMESIMPPEEKDSRMQQIPIEQQTVKQSVSQVKEENLIVIQPNSRAVGYKTNYVVQITQMVNVQRQLFKNKQAAQIQMQYLQRQKMEDQQKCRKGEKPKQGNIEQKDDLLRYVNSMQTQNPKRMKLNKCNIKVGKFNQNIRKLKSINFLNSIEKYLGNYRTEQ